MADFAHVVGGGYAKDRDGGREGQGSCFDSIANSCIRDERNLVKLGVSSE